MHYPFKKYGHRFTRLDIYRERDAHWKIEFMIQSTMQAAMIAVYQAKLKAMIATLPRELRKAKAGDIIAYPIKNASRMNKVVDEFDGKLLGELKWKVNSDNTNKKHD